VRTPLRVFPSPETIGDDVAKRLLHRIEQARVSRARFLLGCPTGRTPRPIFAAMARRLAETRQDLSHLVLVMMDEYLVPGDRGLDYASADNPWSCHHFARVEIAFRLNAGLPSRHGVSDGSIWFPDPADPAAYDAKIAHAGGIDFFMLASGASDGHVAFNPPRSPRESRTRIIALSDETRRDNLLTFPAFRTLSAVPRHGISIGIDTIASAREAVMIVWGAGKRLTLTRMLRAERYEPEWPATVIHECAVREILTDTDAVAGNASLTAAADHRSRAPAQT
jgi:glucosamine-6-phosphate deaminase